MDLSEITRAVAAGEEAALTARATRDELRQTTKPGESGRERKIWNALEAIDGAMKPIRRMIGLLPWEPQPEEQDRALRAVSKRLQYERKQLKKMRA